VDTFAQRVSDADSNEPLHTPTGGGHSPRESAAKSQRLSLLMLRQLMAASQKLLAPLTLML
jgi:hypothetical protein